jgi:hypothetical protein
VLSEELVHYGYECQHEEQRNKELLYGKSPLLKRFKNTGYTQKNGAVSKVNNKFISHLTRAQHTPPAAATVQVSHALPAVRFSCLLYAPF